MDGIKETRAFLLSPILAAIGARYKSRRNGLTVDQAQERAMSVLLEGFG